MGADDFAYFALGLLVPVNHDTVSFVTEPQTSPDEVARDLAKELPSPYCPGRSISTCSSSAARALENDMVDQARAGQSREEIEANLVERFGREVMGSSLRVDIVIAATVGAVLICGLLVVRGRRWTKSSANSSASVAVGGGASTLGSERRISAEEADRLEEELDELREF